MATKNQRKIAHFILQGKGGAGKSFIAMLLAQYLKTSGVSVNCVDTDPVNQTFSGYKALDVQFLKLLGESDTTINSRVFDDLMERLIQGEGSYVIDNGATSFLPLASYIVENDAITLLEESGCDVYIHTVINGAQSLTDTVSGFVALAKQPTFKKIVVWLNEFLGDIEYQGKVFNEMKAYQDYGNKIHGMVRIPRRNQDTFARDIEQMTKAKLTFAEVANDPAFTLMARSRLKRVQDEIFGQLSSMKL